MKFKASLIRRSIAIKLCDLFSGDRLIFSERHLIFHFSSQSLRRIRQYAVRTVWNHAFLILKKNTEVEAETNFKVMFFAHLISELEATERCPKKEDPFLSLYGFCLITLLG